MSKKQSAYNKRISCIEKGLAKSHAHKSYLKKRIRKNTGTSGRAMKFTKHRSHAYWDKVLTQNINTHKKKLSYYHKKQRQDEARNKLLALSIGLLFVFGFAGLMMTGSFESPTGFVTSGTTSTAYIQNYFAIGLSTNMSSGIDFDASIITSFPYADLNASDNYNGAGSGTSLWVTISNDSNVDVDLCTKANTNLTSSSGGFIGIGNLTWSDSANNSLTLPLGPSGSTPYTFSIAAAETNFSPGDNDYFRFWLDVPSVKPGNYNNTLEFTGVKTGTGC